MERIKRNVLFILVVVYGLVVGFVSVWWWHYSDNLFFPNIPGILIGDKIYSLSINLLGDPLSSQANYSIPWVLRVPHIYVPVSIILWGLVGLIIQMLWKKFNCGTALSSYS